MRSTTIEFSGLTLGVSLSGHAGHQAVLLLHGWPQCRRVYDSVLDALGEDVFALAFDLPAIGDSRGAPVSAEKHVLADVCISAAEQIGAKRPVVAGFDVGGMIAFAAARDYGERIAGAMVMNTVVPGLDPWNEVLANPEIWHFAFHKLPELPETLVTGRERAYFDFFIDFLAGNRNAITEDMRAAFVAAYQRPEALRAGFDWYRRMEEDARRNARSRSIDTPIEYVRGDADKADIAKYVRGLKAGGVRNISSRVIPNSGEFLPLENPTEFVRAVREFVQRVRT
jgi:pimeloyl-ACP methyl ester carboxylesterase